MGRYWLMMYCTIEDGIDLGVLTAVVTVLAVIAVIDTLLDYLWLCFGSGLRSGFGFGFWLTLVGAVGSVFSIA